MRMGKRDRITMILLGVFVVSMMFTVILSAIVPAIIMSVSFLGLAALMI